MAGTARDVRFIAGALAAVLIAALVTVVSTPTATEAAGHEHCATDEEGDVHDGLNRPVDQPRADILELCGAYEPTALTFSMRLAEPTDPASDPVWQAGDASVIWQINRDAQAYGGPSGQLGIHVVGGEVRATATWFDDQTPACPGTVTFDAGWIAATFDPRCLEVPATISYSGYAAYSTDPATPDGIAEDVAPSGLGREGEARYLGPLTRSGVAPPSERLAGRLSGTTRIDTAVAISRAGFPQGSEEVYLARADNFPDALAGGTLTRGPILLVPSCGPLPQVVAGEIRRLAPERVLALGGTAAVCDALLMEARDA